MSVTDSLATTPASAGVVVYRHVPTTWNTFVQASYTGRRKSLCGRKTSANLTGVPGLVEQPRWVGDTPGWCTECLREILTWYRANFKNIYKGADAAYDAVFQEVVASLRLELQNSKNQRPSADTTV